MECKIALDHSNLQVLAMTQNLQETIFENTQLKSELSKSEVQLTELEVSTIVNHRFVFFLLIKECFTLSGKTQVHFGV